ncbi:response regulator transcription factor [Cryptosporangium minutisporangium]|uniref:Response regulator transcription factor n=1 Tax=Cryptosporangium minutisporangium TaxID=113569 RepID=A0ABP6SS56_9ACTN
MDPTVELVGFGQTGVVKTDPRILVVDDERYLADLVATALRYENFRTEVAYNGRDAVAAVGDFDPHLIVLDVVLPDFSGIDVCRQLRQRGCTAPVVFLTARDATEDKVNGLSIGGDDYVTKPFSIEELVARIRAVLRRAQQVRSGAVLTFADLEIDDSAYVVRRQGQVIDLTPTEFRLLHLLVANAGRVLSKGQIRSHVWEYDFGGNDGNVQTYISYLRRKVDAFDPPLIHTVPRVGYVVRMPDAVAGHVRTPDA